MQVVIKDETIWCTQKAMAQLLDVGIPAISKHLRNIFEERELQKEVVVSKMEITTQHGAMEEKSHKDTMSIFTTLMPLLPSAIVFLHIRQPSSASGQISAAQAKAKAEDEYDIFNKTQRIDSDFDKQVREMLKDKE